MSLLLRDRGALALRTALLLAAALAAPAWARDAAPPVAAASAAASAPALPAAAVGPLVPLASDEGQARLGRAAPKPDFAPLANQFEAQSNILFCGPTTAAIVLNTVYAGNKDLPRDRSRLRDGDLQYLPATLDPTVARYTQDNVLAKARKTRAQVLGEPVVINGKPVNDAGFQLRQFDELLRAHGLPTRMVVVDDNKPEQDVRADLVANLRTAGDYVIVNYRRDAVGQRGGGHISPLGAYDAESDSFLVLDVNPGAAPWVWMPAATLIKGMRTFDTTENRGYILVQPR